MFLGICIVQCIVVEISTLCLRVIYILEAFLNINFPTLSTIFKFKLLNCLNYTIMAVTLFSK